MSPGDKHDPLTRSAIAARNKGKSTAFITTERGLFTCSVQYKGSWPDVLNETWIGFHRESFISLFLLATAGWTLFGYLYVCPTLISRQRKSIFGLIIQPRIFVSPLSLLLPLSGYGRQAASLWLVSWCHLLLLFSPISTTLSSFSPSPFPCYLPSLYVTYNPLWIRTEGIPFSFVSYWNLLLCNFNN